MPARRCPRCNLVNPGTAMVCDCGYSFADGSVQQSYLTPKQQLERSGGDQTGNRLAMAIVRIVFMAIGIAAVKIWLRHY